MENLNITDLPDAIETEEQLEELLSRPSKKLVDFANTLNGDIAILGVAGKMGITLARMAVRAFKAAGKDNKVLGVARFSNESSREELENYGIKTVKCDFLNREDTDKLPDAENIIYMAGKKFGTAGSEDLTWAMNTVAPANTAFRYKGKKSVVFSTGCVYPLRKPGNPPTEEDIPEPIGDYAQSALGRERVYGYFSRQYNTPVCIYRLNYAIDMRYGVMHDIANQIINNENVNITSSHFNSIWQRTANEQALLCLDHCTTPATFMNITGPEEISVKESALTMAKILKKEVSFVGEEGGACYLNGAEKSTKLFGAPEVSVEQMLKWQAQWILTGGKSHGKPTHFEVNTGKF